jgi:two-component system, NarL family, sensor histidine kinase DesK
MLSLAMRLQWLKRLGRIGWEPYAWLIYSVPFLVTAFASQFTARQTLAMLVGYVAFLAMYFAGYFIRGRRIFWSVMGLDLLALLFGPQNPTAATLFVYASAQLGPALPVRHAVWALAGQVVLAAAASVVLQLGWLFLIPATAISALVGAVTIQAAANAARDARLRLAQAEVEHLAKVAERERIARDLHDVLGHTLSVIVLKSELAQKLLRRDADRARNEVAEIESIARSGLAEVRDAITGYRASGLLAEIERVSQALSSAGIATNIMAPNVDLAPAQETALSLALREAATNVIRHARATRCDIRFYQRDGSLLMEVVDDGVGGAAPFGNGLSGMRERIMALGGALTRETDRGTRLRVQVPLASRSTQGSPV